MNKNNNAITGGEIGGGQGRMIPSKLLRGGTEVLKSPLKFFNSFFSILVLQCYFFAHLRNSTVGNTGIDTNGLVHVHLLIDLGL